MPTTPIQIQLPSGFSPDHERVVIHYLAGRLFGREAWAKAFEAFDLLDRQQRYSPSDLTLSGMAGDIKTSIYSVQAAAPLVHDFYIVRLFARERAHTLVVLLQPQVWDIIDGDTVPGHLDTVVEQLPAPVRIRHRGHELVVVDYDEWKRRILRLQGGEA